MALRSRSTPQGSAAVNSGVQPTSRTKTQSESQKRVKILVVEDYEIVRKGLYMLIDGYAGWKVCGEASNGKEAIEKTLALRPDVVVMDVVMPLMNGIEATKQIRKLRPSTKVVVVSMYDSQQLAAAKAGAHAYVSKSLTWADLRDAITAVLEPGFSSAEL